MTTTGKLVTCRKTEYTRLTQSFEWLTNNPRYLVHAAYWSLDICEFFVGRWADFQTETKKANASGL